jgi:hypothetical protein
VERPASVSGNLQAVKRPLHRLTRWPAGQPFFEEGKATLQAYVAQRKGPKENKEHQTMLAWKRLPKFVNSELEDRAITRNHRHRAVLAVFWKKHSRTQGDLQNS